MKKLAIILLATLLTGSVFAVGGLENQFYFRFGYVKPLNSYMGLDESSFGMTGWDYVESSFGGEFELGSIFMLNSIPLGDMMRLGINADYLSMSYVGLKGKNDDTVIGHFQFGSKVGPSFSFNPVSSLVLDAFVKINPVWVGVSAIAYDEASGYDDEGYVGVVGIKYCVGMNVRYSIAMISFELNPGSMLMTDVEDSDLHLGNGSDPDAKTNFSTFNFKIGLSF